MEIQACSRNPKYHKKCFQGHQQHVKMMSKAHPVPPQTPILSKLKSNENCGIYYTFSTYSLTKKMFFKKHLKKLFPILPPISVSDIAKTHAECL